jgi:hypothetical protein
MSQFIALQVIFLSIRRERRGSAPGSHAKALGFESLACMHFGSCSLRGSRIGWKVRSGAQIPEVAEKFSD